MINLLNNRFQRHFLFWLSAIAFYLFIQIPNLNGDFTDSAIWIIWILPIHMLSTYCLIYFLIPRYLLKKKYVTFSALLLLWVMVSAFLNDVFTAIKIAILVPKLFGEPCDCKFGWSLIKSNYFSSFEYYAFLVAFIAGAIKLFEFWNEKQKLNKKLAKEKIEAEIKLLKAQLHPEFLFKTLDNLHVLTKEKSKLTSTVVMKFSHLLSYLLYESQTELVSLEKEIEMLNDFIYLEKIQYLGNLEVSLNFTGDIETTKIAPLLLFPIIESAFQNMDIDNKNTVKWLSLDLSVHHSLLNFKVVYSQNTQESVEEDSYLENVKKYLKHIYPNQYEFKTTSEEDFFVINLHLKLIPNLELSAT
ncbi:MAG: histidine kinase [Bacteroidota bacterium]